MWYLFLLACIAWWACYDSRTLTVASNGQRYRVLGSPEERKRKANLLAWIDGALASIGSKRNYTLSESTRDDKSAVTYYKRDIRLCLRVRDRNTLLFVALHEYAHVQTLEYGHGKVFWEEFERLLQRAEKLGLYTCVDYAKSPARYCGTDIRSSPHACSRP